MPDTHPFFSTQITETLAPLQQSSSKKIDNGFLMLRANYEADHRRNFYSSINDCIGPSWM